MPWVGGWPLKKMYDSHLLVRTAAMSAQRATAMCSVEHLPCADSVHHLTKTSPGLLCRLLTPYLLYECGQGSLVFCHGHPSPEAGTQSQACLTQEQAHGLLQPTVFCSLPSDRTRTRPDVRCVWMSKPIQSLTACVLNLSNFSVAPSCSDTSMRPRGYS